MHQCIDFPLLGHQNCNRSGLLLSSLLCVIAKDLSRQVRCHSVRVSLYPISTSLPQLPKASRKCPMRDFKQRPINRNRNASRTHVITALSSRNAPVCGSSQNQCAHKLSQRPASFPTSSAAPLPRHAWCVRSPRDP